MTQPKRIVHVANFPNIRIKGCFLDSMPMKVTNGLIRNGHQVVTYSDRDLLRTFSMFGHMSKFAKKKANKNFIEYIMTVQPDAIILEHADTIDAESIKIVREKFPNMKVMQINVDDINPKLGDWNINNIKSKLDVVDFTLITTADAERFKIFDMEKNKIGFIPNPVDSSIEKGRAFEHEELEYDLICAANPKVKRQFCGKFEMTADIVDRIATRINMQKVLFPKVVGDKLDGANYQNTLANSAMVINLSRINEDYLYSSDRMAHAMGNGCLTLVDIRTGFDDIFTKDEVAFFETEEELYKLIDFYRKNPQERMRVARNGWNRYHQLFNELVIGRYVADLLFDKFNPADFHWPTIGGGMKHA